jgi:hypothetical protein
MHKPTFRNFHKQKYTLLSKIAAEITQWTTTHNTQKFRQMPRKTPMWGNPTRERERERERERDYSSSGKYKTTTHTHFQPRKIPHSTKTVPPNSASFFVPNSVLLYDLFCTSIFVPTVSCTDCLYGPETTNKI